MRSPEVTVLTAVHNGARHLGETIGCIQAQTFNDWEYVIVDDASEDATVQVVETAMRRDARIRLVRRGTSGGPYTAANEGLRVARGTYVVRIDADDLSPSPHPKATGFSCWPTRSTARVVSFYQLWKEHGPVPGSVASVPLNSNVFCWYLLLRCPSTHSSVCFLRSAMAELGGYRELPRSQDYHLWCELTRRKWLGVIPEVLSYVRTHESQVTVLSGALQREFALDALADHLLALAGETWTRADLKALFSVGHSERMSIRQGLEMLERWDRLWRVAPGLTSDDQRELARLSAFRRWKHLRANPVHSRLPP